MELYILEKFQNVFDEFNVTPTDCINYTSFIKFNVDTLGKLTNIENSDFKQYSVKQNEGLDETSKNQLNQKLDSLLKVTSGHWMPAKDSNKTCLSKPLLVIVLYNYIGNCTFEAKDITPIFWVNNLNFTKDNEYTIAGIFQFRRFYRNYKISK